ncbi:MAG: sulfatase-like hydrolase/transferase [Acidobacteriota bacterium]
MATPRPRRRNRVLRSRAVASDWTALVLGLARSLPQSQTHSLAFCLALGLTLWGITGCQTQPSGVAAHEAAPAQQPPSLILLITVDALRADAIGALAGDPPEISPTPHLDRLVAEAQWASRAIAPASESAPALASVLTGLRPWQHGVLHGGAGELSESVFTLAEALRERGYETHAYVDGYWPRRGSGYQQGFETYRPTGRGKRASGHLASLDGSPSFVWVHLDEPTPPYPLKTKMQERFQRPGLKLPQRVAQPDLEPFRNPRRTLSPEGRESIWPLYLSSVMRLDRQVGRLLDAVTESGLRDSSAVAFTSLHGEEFGEQGQIRHGNNLGRAALEVPLLLRVPSGDALSVGEEGQTLSNQQLFATFLSLAGGAPAPGTSPSLMEGAEAVVSEHYLGNGVNLFSLVQGDRQLVRRVRFSEADRSYFRARRAHALRPRGAGSGGRTATPSIAEQEANLLFQRLEEAFMETPPFEGASGPIHEALFHWPASSESPTFRERIREPATQRDMGKQLERQWKAFAPPDIPPSLRPDPPR